MKGLVAAEGRGPFHRDRDVAGAGYGAQQLRRFDVVMVGDGDQGGALQSVLNLLALQIKGEAGSERWCPIGPRIVQLEDGAPRMRVLNMPEDAAPKAIA